MKRLFQVIGLVCLIIFSFFYTDKVMDVVREEDHIMVEINNVKDSLDVEAVDAQVFMDKMIPGIDGRVVNVDKSYKAMRVNGIFNVNDIVFDVVHPDVSIVSNKDKYIVSGNLEKKMISFIFVLDNNRYFDEIERIAIDRNIVVNYFVDYQYLINNSIKIKEISNGEFYSYGDGGNYTPDNLLFSNNLLSRISGNEANLCLVFSKVKSILDICSKNNLYTIVPNVIGGADAYNVIKKEVSNGSMIFLLMNKDTVREFNVIIDYVKGKGLKVVGLSDLISEELS